MKWGGLFAAALLIAACFMPWYQLPWNNGILSGVDGGIKYGKPGYWHFVFCFFFIVFTLVPRIWAKQWNLLVCALNAAWMIRNFFALAVCNAGDCPERQTGIWLVLVAALLMLVSALFPPMKVATAPKK